MTMEETPSPDFGRLRQALMLRGEPDRVPLAEVYIDNAVKTAFLGRTVDDLASQVEFYVTAGYDYVELRQGLGLKMSDSLTQAARVAVSQYSVFAEDAQERTWAEEGKGSITNRAEFTAFPWPDPEALDYSPFQAVGDYLPRGMKVIAVGGKIFSPIWELMGFEAFCQALMEDEDLIARMYDRVGCIQYRVFEIMATFDCVGAMWMADDLAYGEGFMVSPRHYRKYLFPWYKRMGELCQAKGLPLHFHTDGKVYDVIDDLIACGVNALHPIEPKAMDIVRVKQQWGGRLCLVGNIDLGYTLTRGAPQEVDAEVRQRIGECGRGGGYCVGSSNAVTNYVPLANFNAMRQATFRYGRYPLSPAG
jgi:uroporphyrinogen decarboxylase